MFFRRRRTLPESTSGALNGGLVCYEQIHSYNILLPYNLMQDFE